MHQDDDTRAQTAPASISWSRTTSATEQTRHEAPAWAVGSVVAGKYLVEGIVGEGAMGIVLRARHQQLREHLALKVLRPSAARNPDAVARFLREARALAKLRTEHVARVMDVGTLEDGAPFIAMELLDGRDLAVELSERGALDVDEAIDIVRQIARAMRQAHGQGVVHRDLKPSNVFLTRREDGTRLVKVIDFGIARGDGLALEGEADLTAASVVLGSPAYMAPEQIRSADAADAQSDIWSLGVIAYEILAGRRPFAGSSTGVLAAICSDAPPPLGLGPGGRAAALERVVLRCLSKDRASRFASMADVESAIERLDEAAPAESGSSYEIAGPARAPARRTSRWGIAGAALVIPAASVLAFGLGQRGTASTQGGSSIADPPDRAASARVEARAAPASSITTAGERAGSAAASSIERPPVASDAPSTVRPKTGKQKPVKLATRSAAPAADAPARSEGDIEAAIADRK